MYVNQVGAQDELVFDGGSFVMNSEKEIIARASQFKEEVLIFDLEVQNQASTKTDNLVQITSDLRTEAAANTPPPLFLLTRNKYGTLCVWEQEIM